MHKVLFVILAIVAFPAISQAAGDAAQGKKDFTPCAACHTVDPNAKDKVGPNLYGVVGRQAGNQPGFSYSPAMKKAGFVWDEDKLRKYIANPKAVVPGDKMAFIGVSVAAKIENIIAYLEQLEK